MTEQPTGSSGAGDQDGSSYAELSWSVNPWRANWRRPAAALAICIAVSMLAGYSFNYPNYSPDVISSSTVQESAGSGSGTTDEIPGPLQPWWPSMLAWAGGSLLLLLGFTAVIYLPVRYKLDSRGATVTFLGAPSFRPWKHYRNFYVHDTGVHLTTMPKPSGLDPFRGHFVQYSGNREAVVSYIKAHVKLRGVPEGQEPPST